MSRPSQAQIEAGNYKKRHVRFRGLDIAIENPKGSVRSGVDRGGKAWSIKMHADYGYVNGSMGVDGDQVDVFIGPDEGAETVYVITTMAPPNFVKRDENKCMLAYGSAAEAKAAFLAHYDDKRFFGSLLAMPIDEFKVKVMATKTKPALIKGHVSGYRRDDGAYVRPYETKRLERKKDYPNKMDAHAMDAFNAIKDGRRGALRELGGAKLDTLLVSIHASNKRVRDLVDQSSQPAESLADATLEALSGMRPEKLVRLYGWNDLIAHIRTTLRALVIYLRQAKMHAAADWLQWRVGEWTDEDVGRLLLRADAKLTKGMDMDAIGRMMGDFGQAAPTVLFLKAHVRQHTRVVNGRTVVVSSYDNKTVGGPKETRHKPDLFTLDLFGESARPVKQAELSAAAHSMPKQEAIAEHERLVDVLNSPSHADDKVEAKKQAAELAEMKAPEFADIRDAGDSRENKPTTDPLYFMEVPKAPTNLGAKVTPQVLSDAKAETIIKIAADGIGKLRRDDVDRVLSETPSHYKRSMANYIKSKRADLRDEVDEVMAEAAPENAQPKKTKTRDEFEEMIAAGKREKQRKLAGIGEFDAAAIVGNKDGTRFQMVLQDASVPGKWRTQSFDDRGFSGHSTFNTKQEALEDAVSNGYYMRDDEALDRLQDTHAFKRGNFAADLIRRINMGEIDMSEGNSRLAVYDQENPVDAKPVHSGTGDDVRVHDHPAPIPRRTIASLSPEDYADWVMHHRAQHELTYYEMAQLQKRMERVRSKKNLAETTMREQEKAEQDFMASGLPSSEDRAAQHRAAAQHARITRAGHVAELDRMADMHQQLYESAAKHGKAKHKLLPESDDLRVDFMAMTRRDDAAEKKYAASAYKQYVDHYKEVDRKFKEKPMTKSARILFFKSHVAGYTRKDGVTVKPHEDNRTKAAEKDWRDEENWHTRTMGRMKTLSDDSLRYIYKDANEAASNMEKMNPNSEKAGRYRDEAHYASMELRKRQESRKAS